MLEELQKKQHEMPKSSSSEEVAKPSLVAEAVVLAEMRKSQ